MAQLKIDLHVYFTIGPLWRGLIPLSQALIGTGFPSRRQND